MHAPLYLPKPDLPPAANKQAAGAIDHHGRSARFGKTEGPRDRIMCPCMKKEQLEGEFLGSQLNQYGGRSTRFILRTWKVTLIDLDHNYGVSLSPHIKCSTHNNRDNCFASYLGKLSTARCQTSSLRIISKPSRVRTPDKSGVRFSPNRDQSNHSLVSHQPRNPEIASHRLILPTRPRSLVLNTFMHAEGARRKHLLGLPLPILFHRMFTPSAHRQRMEGV